MKIDFRNRKHRLVAPTAPAAGARRRQRGEDGLATVFFIALLAIMMILVVAESRALFQLRHDTKLIEQQQIKRLNTAATNTVAVIKTEAK